MSPNLAAFLATIRKCEGTAGENGYITCFGGGLFDDFSQHPNRRIAFNQTDGQRNFSTAAGAYQIIYPTWLRLQAKLGLPDFSPDSQDAAAVQLIADCGALAAVEAGDFQQAIDRCSTCWASLPSSKYPQPKRTIAYAMQAFTDAGGVVA